MSSLLAYVKRRIRRALMTRDQRRFELVGPPQLWEMKRRFQIEFLRSAGLEPQHYLLDIGCGVLRGGIPIIAYLEEGHYYGIEARASVLAEGRRELKESDLEYKKPELIVGEHLGDISLAQEFDFIWAFSVLIHLQDAILADMLQFVARHLKSDGIFYANVDTANVPDGRWQEFPGVRRPLSFYEEACLKAALSVADVGGLEELGHVSGDEGDRQRMLAIRKK